MQKFLRMVPLSIRSPHPASPFTSLSFLLAMPWTLSPRVLETLVASRDGLPPLGSDWPMPRLRETGGTHGSPTKLGPSPWCHSPSTLLGARRVGYPELLVPEPRPSGLGRVCS